MKDPRAARMNEAVQEFAEEFFLNHREQGKRASPAECSDLIRNAKKDNGAYRFLLAHCPSEKSLASSFGAWETKRLRRNYFGLIICINKFVFHSEGNACSWRKEEEECCICSH